MSEPMSEKEVRAEHDDFMKSVFSIIEDGMKLKKRMLERGLTAARAKCPTCGGMLQGRLADRNNHIRVWCEGTCKRSMME